MIQRSTPSIHMLLSVPATKDGQPIWRIRRPCQATHATMQVISGGVSVAGSAADGITRALSIISTPLKPISRIKHGCSRDFNQVGLSCLFLVGTIARGSI